jgi:hypothetical protein
MFNNSSFIYTEGFNNSQNSSDSNKNSNSKKPMSQNMDSSNSNNNTDTSSSPVDSDIIKQKLQDSDSSNSSNTKTLPMSNASEGFDILGTENNIKRGKQSNSISVNSIMRDSNNVDPYDDSSMKESFSFF